MIVYVDMDNVMCRLSLTELKQAYKKAMKENPKLPFPPPIPGFFEGLEPMPGAIESVNQLRSMAQVYILTAPSVRNPLCYTEKRLWIEKHFDLDLCYHLILSPDKSLLKGDILIDDNTSGKGQDKFEGRLIHFGSEAFPDWKTIMQDKAFYRE